METLKLQTVSNSPLVYFSLAQLVLEGKTILVHWADEKETIYDILFSVPYNIGESKRGVVISVIGYKSIIIPLIGAPLHETYYIEKMGLPRNTTTRQLVELFNGVKEQFNTQLSL